MAVFLQLDLQCNQTNLCIDIINSKIWKKMQRLTIAPKAPNAKPAKPRNGTDQLSYKACQKQGPVQIASVKIKIVGISRRQFLPTQAEKFIAHSLRAILLLHFFQGCQRLVHYYIQVLHPIDFPPEAEQVVVRNHRSIFQPLHSLLKHFQWGTDSSSTASYHNICSRLLIPAR